MLYLSAMRRSPGRKQEVVWSLKETSLTDSGTKIATDVGRACRAGGHMTRNVKLVEPWVTPGVRVSGRTWLRSAGNMCDPDGFLRDECRQETDG